MANKLKLQIAADTARLSWNPEEVLANALAERALFLEDHPGLESFQRDIDIMLDKAGTAENRMTVLAVLMEAKLIELHGQLKRLNAILIRATAGSPVKRSGFRIQSSLIN